MYIYRSRTFNVSQSESISEWFQEKSFRALFREERKLPKASGALLGNVQTSLCKAEICIGKANAYLMKPYDLSLDLIGLNPFTFAGE